MSTVAVYRPWARFFHWMSALLVLVTIPAALIMLTPGIERGLQDPLFLFHKNVGVIILLLVAVRLVYRLLNPPPPLPSSVPPLQRHIAEATHWLLYGLLLVMAVSGYIRVTAGGFPLEMLDGLGVPRLVGPSETLAERAKQVHAFLRFPLIGLIALHIGAALYHAMVKRDGVFQRMAPGSVRRAKS